MPFRILLVDDEPFVRDMVASLLVGLGGEYVVAGIAIHGQAALDFLSSNPIDFVITDIKMPVMDGICLIREARRRGCEAAFLVLSAYDEFHLVTEAFKVGARDYLLKSEVTTAELGEALRRLAHDPERRSRIFASILDGSLEAPGAQAPQAEAGSRGSGLPTALQGGVSEAIRSWAQELGIEGQSYRILFLRQFESASPWSQRPHPSTAEHEKPTGSLLSWIAESLQDEAGSPATFAAKGPRAAAILITRASPAVLFETVKSKAAARGCGIAGGLSCESQDLFELRDRYLQAARLCSAWFFHGRGHLFQPASACFGPPPQDRSGEGSPGSARSPDQRAQLPPLAELRSLLALRKPEELARRIPQFALNRAWPSVDEISAMRSYFISCQQLIHSAITDDPEERHTGLQALLEDYRDCLAEEGSLEDCNAWLRATLQAYCSLLASRSRIVRLCLEIVCAQYAGDISLGQIARRLDVSESHLSRLFSHEMGCGFVAYLSRIRVEKARELLQTTSLKVYEIAERCGFPNVEHFSRTFKKILGHSPSDYR